MLVLNPGVVRGQQLGLRVGVAQDRVFIISLLYSDIVGRMGVSLG